MPNTTKTLMPKRQQEYRHHITARALLCRQEQHLTSTTERRWSSRLSKMVAIVEPSRAPPPKKATLSACVRSRVWMLRKAPSRKYS